MPVTPADEALLFADGLIQGEKLRAELLTADQPKHVREADGDAFPDGPVVHD